MQIHTKELEDIKSKEPEYIEDIRAARSKGKFFVYCGAGVSAYLNVPMFSDIANIVRQNLEQYITDNKYKNEIITNFQQVKFSSNDVYEQIKELFKITEEEIWDINWIQHDIIRVFQDIYNEIRSSQFGRLEFPVHHDLVEISEYSRRIHIITPNWDDFFYIAHDIPADTTKKRKITRHSKTTLLNHDWNSNDNGCIYHIHGHIPDTGGVKLNFVLSENSYNKAYNKEDDFSLFYVLKSYMQNNTFLFVGVSLEKVTQEILEQCENNHYILVNKNDQDLIEKCKESNLKVLLFDPQDDCSTNFINKISYLKSEICKVEQPTQTGFSETPQPMSK